MEGVVFAALTKRANYPAAMLCITLVNRLVGDTPTPEIVDKSIPLSIVVDYITKAMG